MVEYKYIENKIEYGKVIDWDMILKELDKMVKPFVGDNYVPHPPFKYANWFIDLSERSVGKTTNYLLLGMLLNKYYNTQMLLLRSDKDQIKPMNIRNLFNTILKSEFNYVPYITDGKYNHIKYDKKCYYYCNINEDGLIDKETIAPFPFMKIDCISNVDNIKSLDNDPDTDFIVLDEFIRSNGINREEEFLNLCHIISTLRRERLSTKIILLANTINPYNRYFKELCVADEVVKLKLGDEKIVKSPLGTNVWIHMVKFDAPVAERRRYNNLQYMGFDNPKLASIIGGTEWAIKNYNHLPRADKYVNEERKIRYKNIFIRIYNKVLQVNLCKSSKLGEYIFIHESSNPIDYNKKPIVYTKDNIESKYDRYALGSGDGLDKKILHLYKSNRDYYSYNDVGNLVEQYMLECGVKKI